MLLFLKTQHFDVEAALIHFPEYINLYVNQALVLYKNCIYSYAKQTHISFAKVALIRSEVCIDLIAITELP